MYCLLFYTVLAYLQRSLYVRTAQKTGRVKLRYFFLFQGKNNTRNTDTCSTVAKERYISQHRKPYKCYASWANDQDDHPEMKTVIMCKLMS
jgi:hypothetical protein